MVCCRDRESISLDDDVPVRSCKDKFSDQVVNFVKEMYEYIHPDGTKDYPIIFVPSMASILIAIFFMMLLWSEDKYQCGGYIEVCGACLQDLPWGGYSPLNITVPNPQTLLTYNLHHFTFSHIISNIIVFIIAGYDMERKYGGFRCLSVYIVSALAGSLSFYWFYPGQNLILAGASGSIFGILGTQLSHLIINYRDIPSMIFPVVLIVSGVLTILIQELTHDVQSAFVHLFGGLSGIAFSLVIFPSFHKTKWGWIPAIIGVVYLLLQFLVLPVALHFTR